MAVGQGRRVLAGGVRGVCVWGSERCVCVGEREVSVRGGVRGVRAFCATVAWAGYIDMCDSSPLPLLARGVL